MKLWLCAREIPYPIAVTPGCFTVAVEGGDPSQGSAFNLARFAPTGIRPVRQLWSFSGSLEIQMKGDKNLVTHHGDFPGCSDWARDALSTA